MFCQHATDVYYLFSCKLFRDNEHITVNNQEKHNSKTTVSCNMHVIYPPISSSFSSITHTMLMKSVSQWSLSQQCSTFIYWSPLFSFDLWNSDRNEDTPTIKFWQTVLMKRATTHRIYRILKGTVYLKIKLCHLFMLSNPYDFRETQHVMFGRMNASVDILVLYRKKDAMKVDGDSRCHSD